jgi:hypothetical protein
MAGAFFSSGSSATIAPVVMSRDPLDDVHPKMF